MPRVRGTEIRKSRRRKRKQCYTEQIDDDDYPFEQPATSQEHALTPQVVTPFQVHIIQKKTIAELIKETDNSKLEAAAIPENRCCPIGASIMTTMGSVQELLETRIRSGKGPLPETIVAFITSELVHLAITHPGWVLHRRDELETVDICNCNCGKWSLRYGHNTILESVPEDECNHRLSAMIVEIAALLLLGIERNDECNINIAMLKRIFDNRYISERLAWAAAFEALEQGDCKTMLSLLGNANIATRAAPLLGALLGGQSYCVPTSLNSKGSNPLDLVTMATPTDLFQNAKAKVSDWSKELLAVELLKVKELVVLYESMLQAPREENVRDSDFVENDADTMCSGESNFGKISAQSVFDDVGRRSDEDGHLNKFTVKANSINTMSTPVRKLSHVSGLSNTIAMHSNGLEPLERNVVDHVKRKCDEDGHLNKFSVIANNIINTESTPARKLSHASGLSKTIAMHSSGLELLERNVVDRVKRKCDEDGHLNKFSVKANNIINTESTPARKLSHASGLSNTIAMHSNGLEPLERNVVDRVKRKCDEDGHLNKFSVKANNIINTESTPARKLSHASGLSNTITMHSNGLEPLERNAIKKKMVPFVSPRNTAKHERFVITIDDGDYSDCDL
eukprot:scaffold7034_cov257-Chaetoceros_neogracile.AAC.12